MRSFTNAPIRNVMLLTWALAASANSVVIATPVPQSRGDDDTFGVPISAPAAVASNSNADTGFDTNIRIAHGNNGHVVAVWESTENLNGTIGVDSDIFFSRSSDGGRTWSPVAVLNSTAATDGTAHDTMPYIATDGNGLWICAWESRFNLNGAGGDVDIFYSRSTNNGQTWSPAALLNSNATTDIGADYDPQLAVDTNGNWLIVWRSIDSLNGSIGNDADLLYSYSSNAGMTWAALAPLNTNAATDSGNDIKPALATDRAGTWIVTWESSDPSFGGNDFDIITSRANWNGGGAITWSPPVAVNLATQDTSAIDDSATIISAGNGTWMIAWSSTSSANGWGTDRDILFSISTDNGVTWSSPAALNTNATTDSGADQSPALVYKDGTCIALWASSQNLSGSGTDLDVFVACTTSALTMWTPPSVFNSNGMSDSGADDVPRVAVDEHGMFIALWQSQDSLNNTIGNDWDMLRAYFARPDCNQNLIADATEVDCNRNDAPDECDIANGVSADANSNGIPDECEEPTNTCAADCAQPPNGVVNVADLLAVIQAWGSASPTADVNDDGVVNVADLLAVIQAWGPCP